MSRHRLTEEEEQQRNDALRQGKEEAVAAILEQGEAVRDIACAGSAAALGTWTAQGALEIWRVAYAAAFRELLANEDADESWRAGAGRPTGLPGFTPIDRVYLESRIRNLHEMDERERQREGAGSPEAA